MKLISKKMSLALLVSLIWAVCITVTQDDLSHTQANGLAEFAYQKCLHDYNHGNFNGPDVCNQKKNAEFNDQMQRRSGLATLKVITFLPVYWLFGYIFLFIGEALFIGLRCQIGWQSKVWWKKLFVLFCVLLITGMFYVFWQSYIAASIASDVPVSPDPFLDIPTYTPEYVVVSGTWKRTDLINDSIMNPLQTSKIVCIRDLGQCFESKAYVISGENSNVLASEFQRFQVVEWTPQALTYSESDGCSQTIYTIDFQKKVVKGIGHVTNVTSDVCRANFTGKDSWEFLLVKGAEVEDDLRHKARPTLLNIIKKAFSA